jgi:hypothetical protein
MNLRSEKLIPAFLRYECMENSSELYSTDQRFQSGFNRLPRIKKDNDYCYLNLPDAYQGMYLLDRELMQEHLNGPSSVPEYTEPYGIRERAAIGLAYTSPPKGCRHRHFIGYDLKDKNIDPDSLIHHLPNSYINRVGHPSGYIKVNQLIIYSE